MKHYLRNNPMIYIVLIIIVVCLWLTGCAEAKNVSSSVFASSLVTLLVDLANTASDKESIEILKRDFDDSVQLFVTTACNQYLELKRESMEPEFDKDSGTIKDLIVVTFKDTVMCGFRDTSISVRGFSIVLKVCGEVCGA